MGWLSMTGAGMGNHATPQAYLDDQFTYSQTGDCGGTRGTRGMRVIDSACDGDRVWYAAALYMMHLCIIVKNGCMSLL